MSSVSFESILATNLSQVTGGAERASSKVVDDGAPAYAARNKLTGLPIPRGTMPDGTYLW